MWPWGTCSLSAGRMSSGEYDRVQVIANDGGRHTLAARYVQLCEQVSGIVGYDVLTRTRQGSYTGTVSASGGTHDAGGALDLSIKNLTGSQVDKLVKVLRQHGCAAWHRTPDQGDWGPHVHAIDSGANDLSPQAAHQVSEYEAGRNGLASGGADDGPDIRPLDPYQWEDDVLTDEDVDRIANAVWKKILHAPEETMPPLPPDYERAAGALLMKVYARMADDD